MAVDKGSHQALSSPDPHPYLRHGLWQRWQPRPPQQPTARALGSPWPAAQASSVHPVQRGWEKHLRMGEQSGTAPAALTPLHFQSLPQRPEGTAARLRPQQPGDCRTAPAGQGPLKGSTTHSARGDRKATSSRTTAALPGPMCTEGKTQPEVGTGLTQAQSWWSALSLRTPQDPGLAGCTSVHVPSVPV